MTQPSLPLEESLTIGGHVVRVERFLRSEEKLKDYYLESYQVTARASSDKSEGSWKTCTLRKALRVTEVLKDACESEIQLLSLLTKYGHPNVVRLLDHYVVSCAAVGDTPRWDVFYLFAESEVRTLADLLEEHRRLGTHIPGEMALRISTDVVDAVAFLHCSSPPLLHRDIRLGSVVETASGTFKLSGFISAAFPSAYGFPPDQLSAVYEDLGCFTDPDCRSPEMTEVQCQKGVTEKSDIWCLGVLLHMLCYHQHPSRGQGLSDDEPTPVSNRGNGHPVVQELLDTMLQQDPQSRPTAANLQQSLRQALGISQPVARDDPHLNFPSSLRELLTMPRRPYRLRTVINVTPDLETVGEGETSARPSDGSDLDDVDLRSKIDWISPQPVDITSGVGDIFEGHHRVAGRVALKRLRGITLKETLERKILERESAIWRRLRHPHVLRFMGTIMREGSIYMVSPFPTNGYVTKYLEAYPNADRIKLLCETADAVHYLHTQGVVHGDIKGLHILIDDKNHALLSGFDLSKMEGVPTSTSMKRFGTLRWLSPELMMGEPKSFSSDVYALGMTISEVLSGKVPFDDSVGYTAIISDVITGVRPFKIPQHSATGISYENVWDVAEACWAEKPEDRIPMSNILKRLRDDPSLLRELDSPVSFEDGITSISQEPVKTNGGFGNIFLGNHKTAGQVALKCPRMNNEDTIRRFTREARLWQDLKHQHVLPLLGMFNRGLVLYIASPFISNGNLAEYAVTSPGADRIRLLCETADALQYLHAQSFIHGDVKGSNVLIGDRFQALLCDFGLTRECDTATSIGLHGHGTVRWQSPELLEESSKSMGSDAYAFGMTIAEVLTGQAPFNHIKANAAVILAVLGKHARPKEEPEVCPVDGYSYAASWAVAAACWATAPEDRISMTEAFSRLNSSREEA